MSRALEHRSGSGEAQSVRVTVSSEGEGAMVVSLGGVLNGKTLPEAWEAAVGPLRRKTPSRLSVDVSKLEYCDGAGLGLFAEMRRVVEVQGGTTEFVGERAGQGRFLAMSRLDDPLALRLRPPTRRGVIEEVGERTWGVIQDLRQLVAFMGEVAATLVWAAAHPRKVRIADTVRTAEKAGANALPVVCLLGLLIGLILAFQSAGPLERFGAQPLIPTMVSIAVVREMGPLITAVILAGRSGSAFAAEIGTMQVTEELNALKTLGLEPVRFLVVPRILAALVVTPLLTAFNMLMSLVGAYIVMAALGYTLSFFVNSVVQTTSYTDLLGGLGKSLAFAMIVAGIGCLRGIQTRSGPGAVGDSTTRAVVAGIVLTIAADAVIGVVYYYLGI